MTRWDVMQVEKAGQIMWEVVKIKHYERKEHGEADFMRLGTMGLFADMGKAIELARRLNITEKELEKK